MVLKLLSHGFKKFSRSASLSKDITAAIFLGLISVMFLGYAFALGFALEKIITKGLQQADSFLFLNGLLLYYFGFEFMIRYIMQSLPILDIQPYLHLPLKRNRIVHYLLIKSVVHVLNSLVFLLFVPFAFTAVAEKFNTGSAWLWMLSLWLSSLSLHYLVIIFKKKLDDSIWGVLTILVLLSIIGGADYYGWFKLSEISAYLFSLPVQGYYFTLALFALCALLYFLNFNVFIQNVYLDENSNSESGSKLKSQDWAFLQGFGTIGEWINLEAKLILRNKRPRTILVLTSFFMLYGLFFYTKDSYTQGMPSFLIFIGTFITGIFLMNYGQFLFSWQANHFDFTLTRPISLRQFLESKYWLLSAVTIACFLLSIPYAYFGWNILLINTSLLLFNVGVNVFVIMNMAMWAPKKIDLAKGGTLNYEGLGAAQWVMGFPVLLAPYVIYLPFKFAGHPTVGVLAIGFVGLIGIALRNYLLNLTTNRFLRLKHSIAAGFRQD